MSGEHWKSKEPTWMLETGMKYHLTSINRAFVNYLRLLIFSTDESFAHAQLQPC